MVFLYTVAHNQTIEEAIDWFQNIRPAECSRYRSELNYELSRKIYDEKSEFVKGFGDRFYIEGMGGIWDFDKFKQYIR